MDISHPHNRSKSQEPSLAEMEHGEPRQYEHGNKMAPNRNATQCSRGFRGTNRFFSDSAPGSAQRDHSHPLARPIAASIKNGCATLAASGRLKMPMSSTKRRYITPEAIRIAPEVRWEVRKVQSYPSIVPAPRGRVSKHEPKLNSGKNKKPFLSAATYRVADLLWSEFTGSACQGPVLMTAQGAQKPRGQKTGTLLQIGLSITLDNNPAKR